MVYGVSGSLPGGRGESQCKWEEEEGEWRRVNWPMDQCALQGTK